MDKSVGNYVLGRAGPARRPPRVREALVARPESCRARTSASRTTTPCSRAAPEAPGHLSLRGPASDARRDTVGPCWPCRAAAAAHRRDARPWRGGKRQQDFLFFVFFACLLGGWVVSIDTQERERQKGKKIRQENTFLVCMNELHHHAHELCATKLLTVRTKLHNKISSSSFFFLGAGCVADERQVDKKTPARRARAGATRAP